MGLQRLFGASVLCGLLSTTALHAMTPAEVWQKWKDFAASTGQTITTGSETVSGDTLVVSKANFAATQADGKFNTAIDEIRFRDLGDGTVEVTTSPSYSITVDGKSADGKATNVAITVSQTNMRTIAGGSPASTSYDVSADSIAIATTSVTEDGVALPVNVNVVLTGAGGNYVMAEGSAGMVDLTSTFNARSMAVSILADDQSNGSKVNLQANVASFAAVTNGTFGTMAQMEQLAAALTAGFATDFGFTYGPVNYSVDLTENGAPTMIKGKSDGGSLGIALDKTKMAFKGGGKGVEVLISGAQIPFPEVAIHYAQSAFDFWIPVSKSPEPQNFTMVAKVIGLTVSDDIWAMFDPTATLPRDPATVILESKGTARLDADIMNEAAMAEAGQAPGQLQSFEISAMQLTVGGADFTGNGALTFDNSDLVTFQGMPAPTGKIDLKLVGGNGLLDKLIALGYVPEDQAIGVRMMMGLFARPGDGPDTLTSTVEFKDKGLFANGMQLQ